MLSREGFCKALRMIRDQESIDEQFSKALNLVGNGHFVFGTENKYLLALRDVLKEAVNDQYDYIDWWLYEAADDFEIWEADCTMKYCLKEPETNCQGLFNQIHKNLQKRCQKHRMAPDTSFDRLHFSVQQVFAEIRIVWQLVDIWLPAPLDFGQFQRIGCFQCMIVACHI